MLYSVADNATQNNMNYRTLELFLHLANTLHFGKTSRACYISPSALSRTIQRLEEEVDHKLFLRDNRSAQLTPIGMKFRHYAQGVMDDWNQFQNSLMHEDKILSGELRLYCSVTASYTVLTDIFSRFRLKYPAIHIRLETGDAAGAIERVLKGMADVTVAAYPKKLPVNLLFKTITTTPLVFIAPVVPSDVTSLTEKSDIPWKEVPMILAEQALSRKRVNGWFAKKGIKPNIYAEVAGHEAILSMVRLGCGVGVVPKLVLDKSSLKEELRILVVKPALKPYSVGLCLHKNRLASPIVRAFWNIIENTEWDTNNDRNLSSDYSS